MRQLSKVAPDWWDYTTLDAKLIADVAKLDAADILALSRPGFTVKFFETKEEFYLAEALEYVHSWMKSTERKPTGICGPIGPTEQLPLVARIVNDLGISVRSAHFWAMDEWYIDGKEVSADHPLSFRKADMDLCFNRIDKRLRMPEENLHFLRADNLAEYTASYDKARCLVMQGGQGDVKHWAFNDPLRRAGPFREAPPSPGEFRKLSARVVDLHPMTIMQNARTSGGGVVSQIPSQALSVGPLETWKCDRVSIWHAGNHDNPFGLRLTSFMISRKIADAAVPMSLLSGHPDVTFNFLRSGIGSCEAEMH